jgi:transforming growth factor-beta-induced protein
VRKLLLSVLVAGALLMGIAPAMGHDEPGTIADIVVASAGAETPEFATLLAAVSAADPAILEALSDPEGTLTVFAPTDAAFAALAEALGEEAFAGILADQDMLSGVLLYHVLGSEVMSADVVAALEAGEGAAQVQTLFGQYLDIALTEEGGVTVDEANLNLEMVDIAASNGVIHVIDAVLVPETRTIAEIVVESAGMMDAPEFTTLLAAVSAADPAVLETLSDPEAELTVFAPTDAAFAALIEELGEEAFGGILADQAMLTNILLYHVVPGVVGSDALGTMLGEAEDMMLSVDTALEGQTLMFMATEEGDVVINEGPMVVATNIDAINGVIHVIDGVLVPMAESM